ncbi:MAG TPA: Gfo/Idh/MocA family oxidoreductase [Cytophagaceae bacterium]|jgi:predicted dehydrogenase|nr:Gfo/Idh/MocA family oxidoreductase [Cytophagaceae bacterium]
MVVLIIGLGSIAKKHIQVLKKIDPACTLYALRSSLQAEPLPGVQNIYSFEEINFRPDFVLLSSPTANHYTDIEKCLSLNCPLFIEKPVLNSLQQYEKLANAILKQNIITYVACVLRFHPCLEYLKKNKDQLKKINEANIYCGSFLPEWRPGQDYRKLYSANESMGGGVHLDMIHELDYAYWLFGKPGSSQSVFGKRSSLQIDAIDYANYLLDYPGFRASVILNYYRRKPKRTIELVGEENTWTADLIGYTVKDQNEQVLFQSTLTIMDLYEAQMGYFITHIQSKTSCENDFHEAIEVLKICLQHNYAKE